MGSGQRNVLLNSRVNNTLGSSYFMNPKAIHMENHQQEYFNKFVGKKKHTKKKKKR